ncbi:hypothetical protein [Nocardioides terrisoli]|uniref:hypothetical protein n=1 Tax=Nocardioides terrisoli TaxID=3388267 RepID=UPI00287B6622|nr:hypothetical protein [Nocardioides marmorisolisilvae]
MLFNSGRRVAASGVAAAVAAAVAMTAVPAAFATGTAVTGGSTTIQLAPATAKALRAKHILVSGISRATVKGGVLTMRITGGTATPPTYVTQYKGGFRFAKGARSTTVTGIVFNTKKNTGSAVIRHRKIVAFKLGAPQSGNGGPGEVQFGDYPVRLTAAGQKALDSALHTSVFDHHPRLGTGATDVRFKS